MLKIEPQQLHLCPTWAPINTADSADDSAAMIALRRANMKGVGQAAKLPFAEPPKMSLCRLVNMFTQNTPHVINNNESLDSPSFKKYGSALERSYRSSKKAGVTRKQEVVPKFP